jgi:hypothetical protein
MSASGKSTTGASASTTPASPSHVGGAASSSDGDGGCCGAVAYHLNDQAGGLDALRPRAPGLGHGSKPGAGLGGIAALGARPAGEQYHAILGGGGVGQQRTHGRQCGLGQAGGELTFGQAAAGPGVGRFGPGGSGPGRSRRVERHHIRVLGAGRRGRHRGRHRGRRRGHHRVRRRGSIARGGGLVGGAVLVGGGLVGDRIVARDRIGGTVVGRHPILDGAVGPRARLVAKCPVEHLLELGAVAAGWRERHRSDGDVVGDRWQ